MPSVNFARDLINKFISILDKQKERRLKEKIDAQRRLKELDAYSPSVNEVLEITKCLDKYVEI